MTFGESAVIWRMIRMRHLVRSASDATSRVFICVLIVSAFSFAALAQEAETMSTIETEGVATVDAVPEFVEFSLHASCCGANMVEATNAAKQFEPNVRKALQAAELSPAETSFTAMSILNLADKCVRISARLRFRANTFTSAEEGPLLFAGLCDKIIALASGVKAEIDGPAFFVEDKESVENAAIARATEKAYVPAKAAALVMNGQIIAVDRVEVASIVWNKAPDVNAAQPDLQKLTCTAVVRISYAFSPA
jgi:uncharacterized protein YggE